MKSEEIGRMRPWINHHDALSTKRVAEHNHPISHASLPSKR